MQEDKICYNGQASDANGLCDGQGITYPVTEVDTTTAFNYVNAPATTKLSYDSSGNPTSSTVYSGSNKLLGTINSYQTFTNITELLATTTVDATNNTVAYTGYGYDESTPDATSGLPQHGSPSAHPGNQTHQSVSIDGSTANVLTTGMHYYDTGMLQSQTAPGNPANASSCGSGTISCWIYDPTGTFITSTILPTPNSGVGMSTSATNDAASGALLTTTGLNASQTSTVTQYDSRLRPTGGTTPEGGQLTSFYATNQITARSQMNSSQWKDTETFLDAYGRKVRTSIQSSSGWYVTDTCYTNGVVSAQSTPYLSSSANPASTNCSSSTATQFTVDGLGRTTQVASPDGHTTTSTYNGRAVQIADSNGQTKTLQYDLLGNLVGVCEIVPSQTWAGGDTTQACGSGAVPFDISGNGFTTTYTYGLAAHTITVSQGAQKPRIFQTDAAGRTTRVVEPEAGTTTYSYSYNGTGLVTTRTRPQANQTNPSVTTTTNTQYDTLGRVLEITYSDGTSHKHFAYDQGVPGGFIPNSGPGAKGQLTATATLGSNNAIINAGGVAYDIMGRVTQTTDCLTGWCSNSALSVSRYYGYDLSSELTAESYNTQPNNGQVYSVAYGYNTAGQLTNFKNGQNNAVGAPNIYTATASSMQPGGPQFITYGNNTTAYRQYDSLARVTGQWVCGLPGGYNCPNGSHYYYGFALAQSGSKITAETDTVNGDSSQYHYDLVGNLSTATSWVSGSGNGFSVGYDRYGNRWNEAVTHTASGSGPNQILSFNTATNQINSAGYVYDAAGNVMNDGSHAYQYDAENSLVSVDNGSTASFSYTAQNRRDTLVNSAGTFRFAFDLQGRRVTQWDSNSGAVNQTQYYAEGHPVAFWSAIDNNIHFEYQDWVGTERMRTDLNGSTTVSSFSSLPFGEPNLTTGSDLITSHFTGLDQDSGFSPSSLSLHHAMFREYNSTLGRWMSPDPYMGSYDLSDPQSLNRYSYVRNEPLSNIDPQGLSPCDLGPGEAGLDGYQEFADDAECLAAGGKPYRVSETVNVNADGSGDDSLSTVQSNITTLIQYSSSSGNSKAPNEGPQPPQKPKPCSGAKGDGHVAYTIGGIFDAFFGLGPAINLSYIPSTGELFIGGGIGATIGHNLSGGPLFGSNPSAVLPGWSFGAGYNFTPLRGGQFVGNSDGTLAGPAFGVPGGSATVTYSACFSLGG